MFIALFAEVTESVEPWTKNIGEDMLQLFYKSLWLKLRQPDMKDFGKRFFIELCDSRFQIHLLKGFMETLRSIYSDIL